MVHGTVRFVELIPLPPAMSQGAEVLVKVTYDDEREGYLDGCDGVCIADGRAAAARYALNVPDSEHCGEQATMDAGSIATEAGGGA